MPGFVDVLGGCCGFSLYKKQIPTNPEFYSIDNTQDYFFVDDVWISGFLALNNISIWHTYNSLWKDPIRTKNDTISALSGLKGDLQQRTCNKHGIEYFRETYGIWKNVTTNTYATAYGLITLYKNDAFFCETFDKGIYWDEQTLLLLKKYIDPTRNVLEIGGHCGTSTIVYASFLQKDSKLYVCEPQKNMFNLLVTNIRQNKLEDKIYPMNKGVFCYTGEGNMNDIDLDGGGGIVEKRYNEENNLGCNFGGICLGKQGEKISLTTVDEMKLENIGFIHCDAQGSETFIFSKAIDTIRRYKPVILFENNVEHGTYLYDNVCKSYPDYKEEGVFDIKKYCMETLGYRQCIDRFNGSIDTLLIP
jgi:FkbM family methyltransferase